MKKITPSTKEYWRCKKCEKIFAEIIDDEKIFIKHDHGDFIVRFAMINVICNKCGTNNHFESEFLQHLIKENKQKNLSFGKGLQSGIRITKLKVKNNKYFLSKNKYEKLSKNFTEKEKIIYELLKEYGDNLTTELLANTLKMKPMFANKKLDETKKKMELFLSNIST